jgi:hypothetical protein
VTNQPPFQIQFCWAAMRANFRPLRHNGVSADGAPTCRNVSPMHNIFVDRFPSTKSTLPAPMLLSPQNESVLNQYPRKTELKWKAIPGALSYVVQVDIRGLTENGTWYWASEKGMSYKQETTSNTAFTFEFSGAQPGRWRMWAVGSDASEGMKSDWWNFRYSKWACA